jgi:hypothetical protein
MIPSPHGNHLINLTCLKLFTAQPDLRHVHHLKISHAELAAMPNWQPCLALRGLEQYSLALEFGALPEAAKLKGWHKPSRYRKSPIKEIMGHV